MNNGIYGFPPLRLARLTLNRMRWKWNYIMSQARLENEYYDNYWVLIMYSSILDPWKTHSRENKGLCFCRFAEGDKQAMGLSVQDDVVFRDKHAGKEATEKNIRGWVRSRYILGMFWQENQHDFLMFVCAGETENKINGGTKTSS